VCAHRGSPLLDGCGNEARITCPYHAWVYRLDGQLIGAPYMNRTVDGSGKPFDPSDHHLTSLRLEEWEGFLFVTQNPDALELGPRLAGLSDVVGRYHIAGYVPVHRQVDVWDTNWKLLYENFMDAYHVFKVHKNSFAKNGDNTPLTTMHAGDDYFAYHRVGHDANATSGVAHPSNSSLEGEWRHTIVLGAAFPTHVMQLQPDTMLPAHGPVIDRPLELLREYIDHRMLRERQVLGALQSGLSNPDDIVSRIYTTISGALVPVARESVLAHLVKLEREGRAVRDGERWRLRD